MKTKREKFMLCEIRGLLVSISEFLQDMASAVDEEVNTNSEEETNSGPTQTSQRQYEYERLHQMMKYHLDSVKESTGEVTVEDYEYCSNLTQRILAHQSSKKVD
jgi:hypothetical protein